MKVAVRYLAQLRHAAGRAGEEVELSGPVCVRELLVALAGRRPELGGALRSPALLVFTGDEQASPEQVLRDGDVVTLLTPVAGGGADADRAADQ